MPIEPAVDEPAAEVGGVGGEHGELAVVDSARGPAVLALDAHRVGAFLQKPRLIEDQHTAGSEMVDHLGAHQVTGGVGVPAGRRQQPLHRARTGVTRGLGEPPRVLVFHRRQQPKYVGARGAAGVPAAQTTIPTRSSARRTGVFHAVTSTVVTPTTARHLSLIMHTT